MNPFFCTTARQVYIALVVEVFKDIRGLYIKVLRNLVLVQASQGIGKKDSYTIVSSDQRRVDVHFQPSVQERPGVGHNPKTMLHLNSDTSHGLIPSLLRLSPLSSTGKWTNDLIADTISGITKDLKESLSGWGVVISPWPDCMLRARLKQPALVE